MQAKEYLGYWYLPTNKEHSVCGILTIASEEITLKTIDNLTERNQFDFASLNEKLTILGIADSNFFTLTDCSCISKNDLSQEETYRINLLFIGKHYDSIENIKFSHFNIGYSYLNYWAWSQWCNFERDRNNNLRQFSYDIPETIKAKTALGEISIFYKVSTSIKSYCQSIELSLMAFFKLQTNLGYSFKNIYSTFIYPLQNFLTLAVNEPVHITDLCFYDENKRIQVFFNSISEQDIDRAIHSGEMSFSLQDIKHEFELKIQNWLNISEKLNNICNLYFSTRYNSNLYTENIFLSFTQALESYHRIKNKKELILKKRLECLFELTATIVKPLIHDLDPDSFVEQIKDTRNYLTHYDDSLKGKALKGDNLFRTNQKLSFMLQAIFLYELGYTKEKVQQIMNKNREYSFLKNYSNPK